MLITTKKGDWCEILTPQHWIGQTIESIVREKWQTPKGLLHQFRMNKAVKVNGKPVPWNYELIRGDRFQIQLFNEESYGCIPEFFSIEPIFEDDHLLVINKPAGMATHPTHEGGLGTLANAVAAYYEMNGILTKVRYIHRLDLDTSGGIVFAKHALASAILDRDLAEREINRTYLAFVQGVPKVKKGEINEPIGRDRHHPTRRRVSPGGDQAITEFRVVGTFPKFNSSLVQLRLKTGRTHQIRVHLSHIGHPLLGDELYGGGTQLISRQALHAARLQLTHPLLEEKLDLEIPLPVDLQDLEKKLKS